MNGRPLARFRTLRRSTALACGVVMISTLLQGATQPALAAEEGKGRPGVPRSEKPVPGGIAKAKPRKVQKGPRTPQAKPEVAWPAPGSATVELAALRAGARKAGESVRAGSLPVRLRAAGKGGGGQAASEAGGTGVRAKVLDRKAARKAGVDGVVVSLEAEVGPSASASVGSLDVTLDYSAFSGAYGGGWSSRLHLVELEPCALTTPGEGVCREPRPLPSTNDGEKETVTAKGVQLTAGTATVLAAVADTESGKGDYKATPLAASSTWQTNLNTGDFTWSYDLAAPAVPGGLAPEMSLTYSSGGVDGRTGNSNNQASWAGDGFDLAPGFIERRYKPCSEDGVENADGNKPGDLCWGYDNAYASFKGKSGELVPAGTDVFRFRQDDGTRVQRLRSTSRGNGDDDGEYWRLTDPKGVKYYFGYHRLPGWADGKEATDSTFTVPVFGDDSGEKCHGASFADSWCQQAWRWNLDYVEDPRGNSIAYYYNKETNHYGRNLKAADDTPYTRGGTLDRVEYGLRSDAVYSAKALGRMDFQESERCLPDAQTDCDSIATDGFYWYDTPWDLNCEAGSDCDQGRLSPSFFTRKRLTGVTSQVLDPASSAYKDVDSWKLSHRWGMADTDYQLLLDSIQHTGHTASPAVTLPKTTFAYTQLSNRLDKTGDGYAPFVKARVSTVSDEFGGQIDVGYSSAVCDWAALPTPQSNTTRCFPQFIGGSSSDDPVLQWFNKYVVNTVTATDRTGGAPDQVTSYSYLGDAAWHYDDDDGLTKEKFKTWSQWRGYGHVRVQSGGQGGASAMRAQTDTYFLRGMDGDRADASGGTKSKSVTLDEGEGEPIKDHPAVPGFAYKTVKFSKPGGSVLEKTLNRPWYHETARKTRNWGTVTANLTGTGHSRTFVSLDNGAGSRWRTTVTTNTYDTVAGRLTQSDDRGDESTPDDDLCTRTTYATNTTENLLHFPAREEAVSTNCATNPDRLTDVVSDTRYAYDNKGYGAAPDTGNGTAVAAIDSYDGDLTALYRESGSAYDSYGRVLAATDLTADVRVTADGALTRTARTDGLTTRTDHTPATGFATTVKVTPPQARTGDAGSAHTTTTKYDPLRGNQLTVTDVNGKATNFAYDALGRSTKIWLADRLVSNVPNYQFLYEVTEGRPVSVGTRTLGNNSTQNTSYSLYDGFLRARQTQAPGPNGGRLLTDTFYDERGQVTREFSPYYMTGAPAGYPLSTVDDALNVETQTRHSYDGLGRQTALWQVAGNGQEGAKLGTTTTTYLGDRTKVVPPLGGTTTTTETDARGRTTKLHEHLSRDGTETQTTAYEYTPSGDLKKITGPDGAVWSYNYDLRGLQTKAVDPDKGTTTSTYDIRGRLTTSKDARGATLAHLYDNIGRKTELRKDSTTGPLRAKWVHDTISGAKGQLAETIRYEGGQEYKQKTEIVDRLYRPQRTSVTIPAAEGALQGTYTSTTSYNASGTVQGKGYPAAGALPAATYAYTYESATLRPLTLSGGDGTRLATRYTLTGKPEQYEMSHGSGLKTWVTNTYEWGTQRLAASRVDRENVSAIDRNAAYRYDEAGNVLSVADTSGAGTDNQCFTYDGLRRLHKAWTQSTKDCAAQPASSVIGGPAPYWHEYGYNKAGQRTTETLRDLTGDTAKDTKRTYTYPATGASQPHTLRSVAQTGPGGPRTDAYDYDAAGNTTTRPHGSADQTLNWDVEGHLQKVTEPDGSGGTKTTEYVYDAEGNRLIGRTPTETTLYLGGTEITLDRGATQPKGTRYLDLGGGNQAVQTDDGKVSFTLADHHGTAQLSVEAATQKLTQRHSLPFGGPRGAQPQNWPGTRGFVGGTDDTATTGLTHLGAREYDPALGQFISIDPLLESTRPQTLNGYAYAVNNPLTMTDPTGLASFSCSNDCSDAVKESEQSMPTQSFDVVSAFNEAVSCGSWGCGFHQDSGSGGPSLDRGRGLKNIYEHLKMSAEDAGLTHDTTPFVTCGKNPGLSWDCIDAASNLPVPGAQGLKMGKPTLKAKDFILGLFGKGKKSKKGDDALRSGCKCFLPGTDVLMADGDTQDIEDVEIGDKVLATDPHTGRTEPRRVTHLIRTEDDKKFNKLSIATKDGIEDLTATHEHPFWSPSENDWIPAGGLTPGMTLRTDTGATVIVTANHAYTQHASTYNLTIEGLHTYYVLAGQAPVLVHNSGGDWCTPEERIEDASDIGNGHAGSKHAGDFPGHSPTDIGDLTRGVMQNPARTKPLGGGRRAYQGKDGSTVVIHDPMHPDGGTVFRRDPGTIDDYWDELN